MKTRTLRWLIAGAVALLVVTACVVPGITTPPSEPATNPPALTEEAQQPTATVPPTQTPVPTEAKPTDTPAPTSTPIPPGITIDNAHDVTVLDTLSESGTAMMSAAYSPIADEVALYGLSKDIQIWDIEKDKIIFRLTGSAEWGQALKYSPDGKRIASAGTNDYTLRMWDAESHSLMWEQTTNAYNRRLAFSPTGDQVIVGGTEQSSAKIYDTESGQLEKELKPTGVAIAAVAWSSDGRIALGDLDGTIVIYDESYAEIARHTVGTGYLASDLEFSPDGSKLGLGGQRNYLGWVAVWETDNWTQLMFADTHQSPGGTFDVDWTRDGNVLISGGADGHVNFWNVETGALLKSLDVHDTVWSVSTSKDGDKVALAMNDGDLIIVGLP